MQGDQQVIAKEVARRLGMNRTILTADKLNEHGVSDEVLGQRYRSPFFFSPFHLF